MDDTPRRLKVAVISPTRVGFEGTGDSIVVPAYDGLMGILYGLAHMMTLLAKGELTVKDLSLINICEPTRPNAPSGMPGYE